MGRRTEKRVEPAREYEATVAIVCDLCGAESPGPRGWGAGRFDVAEVEVRLREGTSFPEGGSGTETRVDMCPKCFREKLVPWLRSQGAEPGEAEWSW